jgi:multimeric flavodoxin WrbA
VGPTADSPLVLGIAGSPRRHGNSERLLDACLDGVVTAGGRAEKLVVVEEGIGPCLGCNACSLTGACVLEDGMRDVYPRLDAAEAVVVASPVFFATVPAVLKALYDRCQPYWARRYVLHLPSPPKRPGALLLAGGGGDPFGTDAAVVTTRSVFAVLGLRYAAELVLGDVDSPTDAARHPEALARARAIGEQLVSRVLEARTRESSS